jgi:TRAP-type C4-dicarboxylate transport system permease small subunit
MGAKTDAIKRLIKQRRALWIKGWLVIGFFTVLLIVFSVRIIQAHLLPEWLIPQWPRAAAALVVIVIGALITLPLIIEANINPHQWRMPVRHLVNRIRRKNPPTSE